MAVGLAAAQIRTPGSRSIASGQDATNLANGNVSNAEFQYLDGVSSALQTQIDAKLAYATGGNPYGYWVKYTVTAIANAVNGCANANGCWQVNGVLGANKSTGLTQSVTLFQLPANGYIQNYRIKSATACTGTTTLLTGLGVTGSTDLFLVSAVTGYNLKTAVSATNITTALPLVSGSTTADTVNAVASLTSTVDNIDQIVAGCSFSVWVLWSVLP